MVKQFSLFVLLILCVGLSEAQAIDNFEDAAVQAYVERYKDIAIDEMVRTGIPASIKLAQAVLESNAGRSHLAVAGNNHFGIKCGSSWNGRTIMREDDDYKNGKLIKSCFRAFPSAAFSFKAHSEFLLDPKKAYRYGPLFDLDPMDYEAWAKGLKKAGYATNPKYPEQLISIIERYHLYEFDQLSLVRIQKDLIEPELVALEEEIEDAPETDLVEPEVLAGKTKDPTASQSGFFAGESQSYRQLEMNKTTYIVAQHGDHLENIALETGYEMDDLMAYNDDQLSRRQPLEEGQIVYLERKRSSYSGQKTYKAQAGESVFDVAQKFGIRLDKLLKRNKWSERHRLNTGDIVYLKGRRK